MINQPLPAVPEPEAPKDPACEWCGDRPAKPYEVAPPILTTKKQAGKLETVRVMKQKATVAYACTRHRETFDRRKAEVAKRKDEETRARRKAKRDGDRWVKPSI